MNAMRLQAQENNIDIVSTQLAAQSYQPKFITKHTNTTYWREEKIILSLYEACPTATK